MGGAEAAASCSAGETDEGEKRERGNGLEVVVEREGRRWRGLDAGRVGSRCARVGDDRRRSGHYGTQHKLICKFELNFEPVRILEDF
jgi:hypothetical protein